jgi:very-short-patch-repair endonuclease
MRHQPRHAPRVLERELRLTQTDAEKLVWGMLRDRRFERLKFRRQHRLGDFIVDFYCPEIRLVIELDGKRHFTAEGALYDEYRTETLKAMGITVIRFENCDVLENPQIAEEELRRCVRELRR